MPLSEHEKRTLDDLAQRLATDDPEFRHQVGGSSRPRQRLTIGLVGMAAGLGLLTVFCLTTQVFVGIASFFIMFGSLYLLWLSFSAEVQRAASDARIKLKTDRRRR